jgi:glycosyltransferase 2 family protein
MFAGAYMHRYRNQILAGFAAALLCYVVLLLVLDNQGQLTGEMLSVLRDYPWLLVIPLVMVKFASWCFRFLEWQYYLRVIGAANKIGLLDNLVVYFSGYSLAVSPGKIAEVLKAVILKVKTGVPVARSAPIILAERIVDGLAVIALVIFALFLAGDALPLGDYSFLIAVSAGLLVSGLIAVQIRPFAYFCLGILSRLPLIKRFYQPLFDFYESSREIFHLKHVLPTAGLGTIGYLGDTVCFLIILYGFGIEPNWILFLQLIFIGGIATTIGALSGAPNGAGVTEVSTGALLLAIVAPDYPMMTPAVIGAIVLLEGFFHKWFRVLIGALVALIFRQRLFTPSVDAAIDEMEAQRPPIQYSV